MAPFVALDFDQAPFDHIIDFANSLRTFGLRALVTQGTTGRSGHLYICFHSDVAMERAHALAQALKDLAEHKGLAVDCMMPSSPSSPGTSILLPYRGAGRDGYGYNPFVDPETGEAIPVDQLATRSDLLTRPDSVARWLEGQPQHRSVPPANPSPHRDHAALAPGDALDEWRRVVKEVERSWVEGRRNHLTLGFAAYGFKVLGLHLERVEQDIVMLESASPHPEVDARRRVVRRTYDRFVQGSPISVRAFLDEPTTKLLKHGAEAPHDGVLAQADRIEEVVRDARAFPGRGGPGERVVLRALAQAARQGGRPSASGVQVSMSRRQLALEVGRERTSVERALSRLRGKGLVHTYRCIAGTDSTAGIIEVCTAAIEAYGRPAGKSPKAEAPPHVAGGQNGWAHFDHPAFHHGALGRTAADVVHVLASASNGSTVADLLKPCDASESAVRRALHRLSAAAVVARARHGRSYRYTLVEDFVKKLDLAARRLGVLARINSTKDRQRWESHTFRIWNTARAHAHALWRAHVYRRITTCTRPPVVDTALGRAARRRTAAEDASADSPTEAQDEPMATAA